MFVFVQVVYQTTVLLLSLLYLVPYQGAGDSTAKLNVISERCPRCGWRMELNFCVQFSKC